jgi:hypothetical protein
MYVRDEHLHTTFIKTKLPFIASLTCPFLLDLFRLFRVRFRAETAASRPEPRSLETLAPSREPSIPSLDCIFGSAVACSFRKSYDGKDGSKFWAPKFDAFRELVSRISVTDQKTTFFSLKFLSTRKIETKGSLRMQKSARHRCHISKHALDNGHKCHITWNPTCCRPRM